MCAGMYSAVYVLYDTVKNHCECIWNTQYELGIHRAANMHEYQNTLIEQSPSVYSLSTVWGYLFTRLVALPIHPGGAQKKSHIATR